MRLARMHPLTFWTLLALVATRTLACAPAAAPPQAAPAAPVAAAPASSAAAPANATAPAAPPPPVLQKVRYGTVRIIPDAPIYSAIDEGYFAEQGIEVELIPFDSGANMVAPLATGQLEAGGGGPNAGLYNAFRSGVNLRLVADRGHADPTPPGYPASVHLVRKALVDSGQVRGPADLKGLRVARSAPATAGEVDLSKLLAKGGLTLADVDITNMSQPDMLSAFGNGNLDFAISLEPFATMAVAQGSAAVLGYDYEVNPYHQIAVLIYSPEFSQSELATKFMVAYLKGVRQYNDAFVKRLPDVRERTIATLMNYTAIKDRALYDQITLSAMDPDGKMNLASFDEQQDWFIASGAQQGRVTVRDFIDLQHAETAARLLGPYR